MNQTKINADAIPLELRQRKQWVLWRYEQKDGAVKPTKVPYRVNGKYAKSTVPETWDTFEMVHYVHDQQVTPCDGIGYVFADDDPYVGVDLDNCIVDDGDKCVPDTQSVVWLELLNGYAEVSPSWTGVKIWVKGDKHWTGSQREWTWKNGIKGKVEVYSTGRFFTVTGEALAPVDEIPDGQEGLDIIQQEVWPTPPPPPRNVIPNIPDSDKMKRCLAYIRKLPMAISGEGGSGVTLQAACECFRFGLDQSEAIDVMRQWNMTHCEPLWSERELQHKIESAYSKVSETSAHGVKLAEQMPPPPPPHRTLPPCPPPPTYAQSEATPPTVSPMDPQFKPVSQLVLDHPKLNQPIIEGLLRQGETMNMIAPPKTGKSWVVTDLAIAVATGTPWLDRYATHAGNVLILDNELHACTTASRIPRVAEARGHKMADYGDRVSIDNLRGRLMDIRSLAHYFRKIEPGQFKLIILDAFYRFMPAGTDENDNGGIAQIYNAIDAYSQALGCAFVLIHHTSKGNQSERGVTDVGAGAGSQSRAADSHLVFRQHAEDDTVVMDAAVRSWAPIEPQCLRWEFPIFQPDDTLDPYKLRKPNAKSGDGKSLNWTPELFAEQFVSESPIEKDTIILRAQNQGISGREANSLLRNAEAQCLIFRWSFGPKAKVQFSTRTQI